MPRIGPTELIIVLFIILVIFGAGRLPEIGGAIGKGIRAFKRGHTGDDEETEEAEKDTSTKSSKRTETKT